MNEITVGSTVERTDFEGRLIVKMLQGKRAAVVTETGDLEVYPLDQLFLIPGQDYNYLRRIVCDSVDEVYRMVGGGNMQSQRAKLALSRLLYDADVRRGTDMIEHAQKQIHQVIIGALTPQAVEILTAQIEQHALTELSPVIMTADPAPLTHYTPEGSTTLVPGLNDDELALMCCDVADMIASSMGFAASAPKDVDAKLSELQRRISIWAAPRGNVRKNQTWELAKKVVGHCRQAEVDDAIENVLEAIRQQEDPEDYI